MIKTHFNSVDCVRIKKKIFISVASQDREAAEAFSQNQSFGKINHSLIRFLIHITDLCYKSIGQQVGSETGSSRVSTCISNVSLYYCLLKKKQNKHTHYLSPSQTTLQLLLQSLHIILSWSLQFHHLTWNKYIRLHLIIVFAFGTNV